MSLYKFPVCFLLSDAVGRVFSITKENGQKYQASSTLLKA